MGGVFRLREVRGLRVLDGGAAGEDPGRAGFEIRWRETTSPQWLVYDFVKGSSEYTLEGVSTDNHFFAVRTVGKYGARSYVVRWSDTGHLVLYFPGSDAQINRPVEVVSNM